jgi:hypothetical protein
MYPHRALSVDNILKEVIPVVLDEQLRCSEMIVLEVLRQKIIFERDEGPLERGPLDLAGAHVDLRVRRAKLIAIRYGGQ